MNDLSQIDQDQYRQLLEEGKTPDEAAHILLQARRTMAEVCQHLLDQPTEALQHLLDELDAQKATDDNKG